jgi:hypothetical protein
LLALDSMAIVFCCLLRALTKARKIVECKYPEFWFLGRLLQKKTGFNAGEFWREAASLNDARTPPLYLIEKAFEANLQNSSKSKIAKRTSVIL